MEHWIEEARNGDRQALGCLWQACEPYLLKVSNRTFPDELHGKSTPSSLVQDTFIKVQRGIAEFRGTTERELLIWMRQILQHERKNLQRKFLGTRKRQLACEVSPTGNEASSSLQKRNPALADDELSPSQQAMAREVGVAVDLAMQQLPDSFRQVVKLRIWHGLSFPEIGDVMNKSAEAVRKDFSRAAELLVTLLGHLDESIN